MYDVTQWAYSKLTPGVVAELTAEQFELELAGDPATPILLDVYGQSRHVLWKQFDKLFTVVLPLAWAFQTHEKSWRDIAAGFPARGTFPTAASAGFSTVVEEAGEQPLVTYTIKGSGFRDVHDRVIDHIDACEIKVSMRHRPIVDFAMSSQASQAGQVASQAA